MEYVRPNEEGLIDMNRFEELLKKYQHRKSKIAAVTACSNIKTEISPGFILRKHFFSTADAARVLRGLPAYLSYSALSNASATSSLKSLACNDSSAPLAFTPSSSIVKQYGQAVATTSNFS